MMRASIWTAALGMFSLVSAAPAAAQDMMRHIDLTSPEMTSAEMTRADVEAVIAAATSDQPADFTGKKLSGLDLSGLDLSGALLRAARLNRTKLNNAKLDRAILDQAWLLEADLSRASLRGWPLPGPHPARHAGLQRGLPGREIERASLCFQSPARICRNLACRLNAL